MLLLYAVTDSSFGSGMPLCEQVEKALQGGATIIQLREKNIENKDYVKKAAEVKKICKKYGVPLIVNDNVRVALESGADGVHVGIDDTPVSEIRAMAPTDFIIGATAKTVEQAGFAEKSGADYIGVGAVFPSPTKTNAIRITKEKLREIALSVNIPAVAIGGINAENAIELKGAPIYGIAVVSAVFGQKDIRGAAERLKKIAADVINPVSE